MRRGRYQLATVILAAFGATPVLAQGGLLHGSDRSAALAELQTADAMNKSVLTVLARNKCRISEPQIEAVFAPEGLSFDVVSETLTALHLQGLANMDHTGTLKIASEICPPDEPAPTPRDAVLKAFRDGGCELSEDDLLSVPEVGSLSDTQRLAILGPMRDRGELETGSGTAKLADGICRIEG